MSRGDFSFMRPVRVRSRAVLGRYFFRSDHSTRLVVKEEVPVSGLCGTLVKPTTSLLGVWVVRWLRCPWAMAGPGRASRRRAELNISDQAPLVWRAPEGPEGTGGLRGAAPNEVRSPSLAGGRGLRRPEHQRGHKQPSGTGRRHDPRLGRQGTQSCNPESIRNVGGATRPGHSQGRPDKRNDVLGGPAQAS